MADNYLEKRYAEVFCSQNRKPVRQRPSLDTLLSRNRSCRSFNPDYSVHRLQLEAMVNVNARLASHMPTQCLRFRCFTKGEAAVELHSLGPAVSDAFIVVCSTSPESPDVDIDIGLSLQAMLLKAVEMGLGGFIVRDFNKAELKAALNLPNEPLAVLCVGKPDGNAELVPSKEDNEHFFL